MTKLLSLLVIAYNLIFTVNTQAKELDSAVFSSLPLYEKPVLSPNGGKIAFLLNHPESQATVLAILDINSGASRSLLRTDNEKEKFNWFEWANDNSLVVSIRYPDKRFGIDSIEGRLIAVDTHTKNVEVRPLIKPRLTYRDDHFSQYQDLVIDFLPKDPNHILIGLDRDSANLPSVYKLNIYTSKLERVERGKRSIQEWFTDRQSRVRVGSALKRRSSDAQIFVKPVDKEEWQTLFEFNLIKDKPVKPLGFAKDPNVLYYSAYKGDLLALFSVNLATQKHKLVFEDPNYDVDGELLYSKKTNEVIGVSHVNSPSGHVFWDQQYQEFQTAIDTALPSTKNTVVSSSANEDTYIVYAEAGNQPGKYYLGNRSKHELEILFEQYPELDPSLLSQHRKVNYISRDGTKIEGYLSLPKNQKGPFATIVYPHSGDKERNVDGFDLWSSFLAHRGYAVFRPNYRGSKGYGYQFEQSQVKGLGLTMQDDLTDAAHWLIKENYADPDKICIFGMSYGGYAALMATVKTPELFQCAVSFAEISDLNQFTYDNRWYMRANLIRNKIGDDSDDLKARSPYHHVDKINRPVFLVHGEDDRMVDVIQSRRLAEELQDHKKEFEYLELKNGDHYLSVQRNRHLFFNKMDSFLAKHLKSK